MRKAPSIERELASATMRALGRCATNRAMSFGFTRRLARVRIAIAGVHTSWTAAALRNDLFPSDDD
jgi:hypothetical protein